MKPIRVPESQASYGSERRPQVKSVPHSHVLQVLLGGKEVVQPPQGTNITHGRGCLLDLQDLCGLGARQLFEVSQTEDLAVNRIEGIEGLLEAKQSLSPHRLMTR